MKNLLSYEDFLVESNPMYSFDGYSLKVGDRIISDDGYSGIIVSKEITNGSVKFRDNKGVIHIKEAASVFENLQWWQVAKGILAVDVIKIGSNFVGGGLSMAAHVFSNWRSKIQDKLQKVSIDPKFKDISQKISDKLNSNDTINNLLSELQKYPYVDIVFQKNKSSKKKAEENNSNRKRIMKDITNEVKNLLSPEEMKFFEELNSILKDEKIEEDLMTDPNRTVGTGTYTSTHSDPNVNTGGYSNTTDSASGGSHPIYIS